MYQVLNYGHAYKAKRIILLFPYASGNQTEGVTDKWESQGDDPPIPLDIATIDIRRKPDQITANLPRQLELR